MGRGILSTFNKDVLKLMELLWIFFLAAVKGDQSLVGKDYLVNIIDIFVNFGGIA